MQSWLDNFRRINGLNDNGEPATITSNRPRNTAQRKLGAILGGDRIALIRTNERARLGLKPTKISRFQN